MSTGAYKDTTDHMQPVRTCCALGMVPKRQGACYTGTTLPLPRTKPLPDSLLPHIPYHLYSRPTSHLPVVAHTG
jgi:hypothetical protein